LHRGLFPEDGNKESQQEADDDTGHDGEVEAEFVPLDIDIPWEPPDPGELIPQDQDHPYPRIPARIAPRMMRIFPRLPRGDIV